MPAAPNPKHRAEPQVRNRVRVALPFTDSRLEIRVNGDAEPLGAAGTDANDLRVVFRECSFQLGAEGR